MGGWRGSADMSRYTEHTTASFFKASKAAIVSGRVGELIGRVD